MRVAKLMIGRTAQLLLVVGLISGILLPKATAVLVSILPGAYVVPLCTGHGMTYVAFNAAGDPISIEEGRSHACVMAEGITFQEAPTPLWQRLATQPVPLNLSARHAGADQDRLSFLRLARAPPVSA